MASSAILGWWDGAKLNRFVSLVDHVSVNYANDMPSIVNKLRRPLASKIFCPSIFKR